MNFNLPSRHILLMIVVSLPLFAYGQSDWRTLKNQEFKFWLLYPPTWRVDNEVPNTKVAVTTANGNIIAACIVGLSPTAQTAKLSQRQLDERMEARPMTTTDWIIAFDNAFPDLQILETKQVKLQNRPAALVVTESSSESMARVTFSRTVMASTLTPGFSWKVACSGIGHSKQMARDSYDYWLPTFNKIIGSFYVEQ